MWRVLFFVGICLSSDAAAQTVGAAPKGDATAVAAKIIKANFPDCKKVAGAVRAADGAIRARCDGVSYMVFTIFDKKQGQLHEVALNCTAAKKLLNISC